MFIVKGTEHPEEWYPVEELAKLSEEILKEKIAETYFHWRVTDSLVSEEQDRAIKVVCYSFADQILALVKETLRQQIARKER